MRRKDSIREHRKTGKRQPFRAANDCSSGEVPIPPLRACAGVEQDADDSKIEFCARTSVARSRQFAVLPIEVQRSSLA